ncbi:MAG: hypothetical protein NC184_00735 [Roseburia sp.]|nr:hypothetical protein [Roseburia sp.]
MRADGFGEFLNACEELKNCKYVIAENKIAAVLKSIADNKQLYSMFGAALYGFDYKTTFTCCISDSGFVLPSDPKTAIALVFRILLDIDGNIMPLKNFLQAYFYSESINESFARFGLEVVAPFIAYCRAFFVQSDAAAASSLADGDDGKAASGEVDGRIAQAYESVNSKMYKDLKTDASNCLSVLLEIAEDAITGIIDRAEYSACLNGLVRALKTDSYDDIISAFLGVKYAVAYFFKSNRNVIDIYKKLEYDIKHLAN